VGAGNKYWVVGSEWWALEPSGGRWSRVVGAGVKWWASEPSDGRCSRVVGVGAKWWVSEPSEARWWSLDPSKTTIFMSNTALIANDAGFERWVL